MKIFLIFTLALLLISCNQEKGDSNDGKESDKQGKVLPYPEQAFNGKIGKSFEDSEEDYPQPFEAPEGAPNVIVILLDDVGFGQAGIMGGPVPTPAMDQLAKEGLTYTRFHTTGICSPTRAALLTGRNHHQVGFGTISELSTGYPGYNSIWGKDVGTVAEVLKQNGYSTAAWGKWHNTPDWETNPIGPFNQWPTGLGFEYFYGFQGGETNQYYPQLFKNTIPVEPSKSPEEGYHLTEDLTDDAISWVSQQRSINPDKPYFMYFATGATHAPLHAPKEWIDKFKGKFDEGWDAMREHTLERQKKLGIVPENTKLTARPESIPSWESLSSDEKKLFAHQMEVFAGFLAHTDYWTGKLIKSARSLPGGENTMIIYIIGDNGSSAEGSMTGTLNNMMTQNGFPDNVERQLKEMENLGGPEHENHFAVPWSWAGSTPFQWMKRVPSHFGGTRNGMIVSWPASIKAKGEKRTQFHHVIDIAPTIYEAAHIEMPIRINGVDQTPLAGVPMNYSFSDANAEDTRTTQYFETGGHRAIYHDGWVAASFHGVPWQLSGSIGFEDNEWELYNIEEDFSEAVDISKEHPEKLEELKAIFDQEAEKFDVYPLDDRFVERATNPNRPSVVRGKTEFTYLSGTTRIPEGSAPPAYSRTHTISAKIDYSRGDEGVIVANGGTSAGYTLFIKGGKLIYHYNFFHLNHYEVASSSLPEGNLEIQMIYSQESDEPGGGGNARLFVNGNEVGDGMIDKVVPSRYSATETMDIGMDLGSTVSTDYKTPFAYTGNIEYVKFHLE
ncbi:arylsulfatase [Echinicola shivajiensis]|uniref:arylsulfatase n=1 Tax=Echinicola shivajiensis TaxID=1035916 RepID=UPI001BFCD4D1|nr:arylsulfatase [Echinicola shivajiensis]